jgi:hypothetical protein
MRSVGILTSDRYFWLAALATALDPLGLPLARLTLTPELFSLTKTPCSDLEI